MNKPFSSENWDKLFVALLVILILLSFRTPSNVPSLPLSPSVGTPGKDQLVRYEVTGYGDKTDVNCIVFNTETGLFERQIQVHTDGRFPEQNVANILKGSNSDPY